jgi:hypothetical protein
MACSGWFYTGRNGVENTHYIMKTNGVSLNNFHRLQLLEPGFFGELIIPLISVAFEVASIGNISYVANLKAKVYQVAIDQVKGHEGAAIS